jgi:hypothetical protein
MGQDLLYKVKAIVTISDNETQLDLQIPRKTLVSYPLSEEYLLTGSSASKQSPKYSWTISHIDDKGFWGYG